VLAGITLGAYALPEGVAYASLASLPPQVGVYGYLLGGVGYALFGSSRDLAIGPTSAISLMVAASVAPWHWGIRQKHYVWSFVISQLRRR
jgi:MFS superfamily sulfate permease-like transporter